MKVPGFFTKCNNPPHLNKVSLPGLIMDNLPGSAVITGPAKIEYMIWVSYLGEVASARYSADLYRLAPSTMG
jgi:hypothetical protein